jgi:dynein heavy chain 2
MRKFIALPLTFAGVGDSDVFKLMPDRNGRSLLAVYRKAEALLARLAQLPVSLCEWVSLDMVNMDEYAVSDWEASFRMLKQRGKDVEKLPHQYKVDCVTVSAAPFKAAIDDQMQRFADALVTSLEREVKRHATAVDQFLSAYAVERRRFFFIC